MLTARPTSSNQTLMQVNVTTISMTITGRAMEIFEVPVSRKSGKVSTGPSARAMKAIRKFAAERRAPRRWLDGTDNPTVAD